MVASARKRARAGARSPGRDEGLAKASGLCEQHLDGEPLEISGEGQGGRADELGASARGGDLGSIRAVHFGAGARVGAGFAGSTCAEREGHEEDANGVDRAAHGWQCGTLALQGPDRFGTQLA